MIVTIDGPAGSGKSAAAVLLARALHVPHLDTGAMYRSVALLALERNITDPAALVQLAQTMDLRFDWAHEPATVWVDGRNVSDLIRLPAVTGSIARASENPAVREELVRRQRSIAREQGSLVTEGRDQGSVVFPDADFKFYLDAAASERARRRVAQLATKGIIADVAVVQREIEERDARDMARYVGPLAIPRDAHRLDTTHLTLPQVVDAMLGCMPRETRP